MVAGTGDRAPNNGATDASDDGAFGSFVTASDCTAKKGPRHATDNGALGRIGVVLSLASRVIGLSRDVRRCDQGRQ